MSVRATTFYDDHPFDWTEGYTRRELQATLAPLLASFIQRIPHEALVLDLGCGPGRVMSCLSEQGVKALGLDLSFASVRLMMQRIGKPGVAGNAMALPFADACLDRVIADGVIHHTRSPFAAFAEGCRVLKAGGQFYVAVYKRGGHYQKLYRFPGAMIRALLKHRAGKSLVYATFLPLYYLVHLAKSRGRRSWSGSKNLFFDYFVTPLVEFVSQSDLADWCQQCGAEILEYDPNPSLNVHSFVVQKQLRAVHGTTGGPRENA
jgi:ubiquinone/menaquinone biosynthesis C-methylase UbiE